MAVWHFKFSPNPHTCLEGMAINIFRIPESFCPAVQVTFYSRGLRYLRLETQTRPGNKKKVAVVSENCLLLLAFLSSVLEKGALSLSWVIFARYCFVHDFFYLARLFQLKYGHRFRGPPSLASHSIRAREIGHVACLLSRPKNAW